MSRRVFIPALVLGAGSLAPLADALWAQAVAQETQQAQQAAPGFWSLVFSKGGVVTWVIALLSAVGVPIAAIKLYEFYRMDIFRPQGFEAALSDMRRGNTSGLAARLDALGAVGDEGSDVAAGGPQVLAPRGRVRGREQRPRERADEEDGHRPGTPRV